MYTTTSNTDCLVLKANSHVTHVMPRDLASKRGIKRKLDLLPGDVVTYPYYRDDTPPEGYVQVAYAICDGDTFFTTRRNAIIITSDMPPTQHQLRSGQVIAQVWREADAVDIPAGLKTDSRDLQAA